MISRDLDHQGGVVGFVGNVMRHLPPSVVCRHFAVGRKPGLRTGWTSAFVPVCDVFKLLFRIKRKEFDLAQINPSLNVRSLVRDGVFSLILRYKRIPRLVFFHGWDTRLAARICGSRFGSFLMRFVFGRSAKIVVLASDFKSSLVQMGIDARLIRVMTTTYGHDLDCPEVKSRGKKVLFLSRMVPEKGGKELVQAFARVAASGWTLVMAGDGPQRTELESLSSELGVDAVFPGFVRGRRKAGLLASADIFVLPTVHGEGCPVSILEAMACGLAVVATRVGAIADIVRDKENGILLDGNTPDDIVSALDMLMNDMDMLNTMADKNMRKAKREFSPQVVVDRLVEMYKSIEAGA